MLVPHKESSSQPTHRDPLDGLTRKLWGKSPEMATAASRAAKTDRANLPVWLVALSPSSASEGGRAELLLIDTVMRLLVCQQTQWGSLSSGTLNDMRGNRDHICHPRP